MDVVKKILSFLKPKNKAEIEAVAKKQLSLHMDVITSLRDYDEGKKDISTRNVRKHLPNVRIAPQE